MNNEHNVWLHNDEDKLRSLLADEAKMMPMLDSMQTTLRQLKAKQAFRIALLNQLLDKIDTNE
tara:strand:+ start:1080 stop:1268 length:189 start_codon:yes stop_codon:yes gene_type:complete